MYSEHLPAEVLEAGIKSGRYIQVSASQRYSCFSDLFFGGYIPTSSLPLKGNLSVNKHRAQHEAFVRYEGSASKSTGCYQHTLISRSYFSDY